MKFGLRVTCAAVVSSGLSLAPATARAQGDGRIESAAVEFDAGRRAYLEQNYEEAALHFENAWTDAPRAETLRNAIRCRLDAKQLARAATLAALARRLYGDDAATMDLVRTTLDDAAPKLHEAVISCAPACGAAVDGHAVAVEPATQVTFFVEPGRHDVVVTWPGGASSALAVGGDAGTREQVSLTAPAPPPARPVGGATLSPSARKPLGPSIFWVGVAVTGAAAVATVVSVIAMVNDPGRDAVRRDCVGLGDACPTYERALAAQRRTNVLLVSTAAAGLVTAVVGVFFTQWSSPIARARVADLVVSPLPGGAHVALRGAL